MSIPKIVQLIALPGDKNDPVNPHDKLYAVGDNGRAYLWSNNYTAWYALRALPDDPNFNPTPQQAAVLAVHKHES